MQSNSPTLDFRILVLTLELTYGTDLKSQLTPNGSMQSIVQALLKIRNNASELLDKLVEMFPWYYMDSDGISRFKSSIIHWCVTRHKEFKSHKSLSFTKDNACA